jgi:hypothetical protein
MAIQIGDIINQILATDNAFANSFKVMGDFVITRHKGKIS